jgi:hypothetical protein
MKWREYLSLQITNGPNKINHHNYMGKQKKLFTEKIYKNEKKNSVHETNHDYIEIKKIKSKELFKTTWVAKT